MVNRNNRTVALGIPSLNTNGRANNGTNKYLYREKLIIQFDGDFIKNTYRNMKKFSRGK